jgi:FkbM family methyltransferase
MSDEAVFYDDREVDGIYGWWWNPVDTGAWEGPKIDWETSHKHLIDRHCTRKRTVIQAGGNLGMYPKLLSRQFEKVITFEPDLLNYDILQRNCVETNITAFPLALGYDHGVGVMRRPSRINVGMNYVENVGELDNLSPIQDKVDIIPLDRIMKPDLNVDLLMLDVEGSELSVLLGSKEIITMFRPVIFCERPTINVHSFLEAYGYRKADTSAMDTVFIPWD